MEMDGSADKDKISTLTIKGLNQSSSAVYYCAARYHSATYHCSLVQKPQQLLSSVLQLTALCTRSSH